VGYTRYRIEGDVDGDDATVQVVDRGGISLGMRSKTEVDPRLVGTKHRVATQREVTVALGRRDGRTVIIVPEVKDNETIGLTLLHAKFVGVLPAAVARTVLQGYQGRYGALRAWSPRCRPPRRPALGRVDLVDPHPTGLRARRPEVTDCPCRSHPLSRPTSGVVMSASRGMKGLGTDLVEVARFRLAMERRAALPERLFSDAERAYAFRHQDPVKSLAARFGAKEAVMKRCRP
jgi:hypothetical protein